MNDEKFLRANRTGIFKKLSGNSVVIPKDIRKGIDLESDCLVEMIPLHEGIYIRKAAGKKGED